MTALAVVCALAVVLVTVVVVDGLRLHAVVLRRLHQVDPEGGRDWEGPGSS